MPTKCRDLLSDYLEDRGEIVAKQLDTQLLYNWTFEVLPFVLEVGDKYRISHKLCKQASISDIRVAQHFIQKNTKVSNSNENKNTKQEKESVLCTLLCELPHGS